MDDTIKKIQDEVIKKKLDVYIWACPHPGCDKTIPSLYMRQVVSQAKKHLESHAERMRL